MLNRLGFPAVGRHRRFVGAIGIDALGSGVWMPLSVLYFTVATDLGLVRIGTALSLAALVALPLAPVVGALVDRYGARRVILAANLLQAAGFALYPFAHAWWSVTLVVALPSLGRTAYWGSYAPLVAEVSAPGEREKWFGFLGALRNAGFGLGGLAAGAAISAGTPEVFHAVAVANAVSYLLSFALLLSTSTGARVRSADHAPLPGGFGDIVRDVGYRWLLGANLGYALGCLVLNVVLPVYIVRELGLDGWVSGVVYVINTVLIGIGQGVVVRRMAGTQRYQLVVLAAALMAAGFVLLFAAAQVAPVVAVAVVLLAAVVYTLGEMTGGPVLAAMAAEAPPEHLRGRYLAAHQLTWNGSAALAPLLYLWLLDQGHGVLWGATLLIVLLGAACCLPLRSRLPLAAGRVTNRPVAVAGEAA